MARSPSRSATLCILCSCCCVEPRETCASVGKSGLRPPPPTQPRQKSTNTFHVLARGVGLAWVGLAWTSVKRAMCDGASVENLEGQRPEMPLRCRPGPRGPGGPGSCAHAGRLSIACCRQAAVHAARLRSPAPAGTPALIWCGATSRASHGAHPLQLAVEPPEEDHIQP